MTEQMDEQPWTTAVREQRTMAVLESELKASRVMVGMLIRRYGKTTMDGGHSVTFTDMELTETPPDARLTIHRDPAYRTTSIKVDM